MSNGAWVILDRDGVINVDSDHYIKSAQEWIPIEGSLEAIVKLKQTGFKVAVATNQSGLARRLFELDDLEAMHEKLQNLLSQFNVCVDAIFYCPHAPGDRCNCRKPASGMLDALEQEFHLNLDGTWLVGDHLKDLQLAKAKNCKPVLVLTGKGLETQKTIALDEELKDTPVFENLKAFVNALLEGKLS